jgi:hypothetical protein
MIKAENYIESRRCRKPCCANVPSRPDGRIWQGVASREIESQKILGPVIANELGWDDDTYVMQITKWGGMKFEPDEWEALEKT